MFKVCRRNFKLYNFERECRFCSLICFIIPMYNNMAWYPAEVDYFTLIGNTIITVQSIIYVWMIIIHNMKKLLTGKWIWKYCKMCIFRLLYAQKQVQLHLLQLIKNSVNFLIGSNWLLNFLLDIFFKERVSNRVQSVKFPVLCINVFNRIIPFNNDRKMITSTQVLCKS